MQVVKITLRYMGTATSIQRIASLDANSLFAVCSNILRGSGSKSRYCDSADPAAGKKGKQKNVAHHQASFFFIYAPESFRNQRGRKWRVSLSSAPLSEVNQEAAPHTASTW